VEEEENHAEKEDTHTSLYMICTKCSRKWRLILKFHLITWWLCTHKNALIWWLCGSLCHSI